MSTSLLAFLCQARSNTMTMSFPPDFDAAFDGIGAHRDATGSIAETANLTSRARGALV
jgi:hypothetical protein